MGKMVSVVKVQEGNEPATREVEIEPGATGRDLKRMLGLGGFALFTSDGRLLTEEDNVYLSINDGDKIEASPLAKVSFPSFFYFLNSKVRPRNGWHKTAFGGSRTRVTPGSLFDQRWTPVQGNRRSWQGYYQANRMYWWGWIEESVEGFNFFIHNPPSALREHPIHGSCVIFSGVASWFLIHFSSPPRSPEAGIHAIEDFLKDALSRRW